MAVSSLLGVCFNDFFLLRLLMVELADWTKAVLSKVAGLAAGREDVRVLSLLSRFSLHKKVLLSVSLKIIYLIIIFLRFSLPPLSADRVFPITLL